MQATPSGISMIIYAVILLVGSVLRILLKMGFTLRPIRAVLGSLADKKHENATRKALGYFIAVFIISSISTSSALVLNKYLPTGNEVRSAYRETELMLDISVAGARSAMDFNDTKITYFSN